MAKKKRPPRPKLVMCGDHQWSPYSLVCVHLKDGSANHWIAVPQEPGTDVENDWVCCECYAKGTSQIKPGEIVVICIHCVRKLQERDGVTT